MHNETYHNISQDIRTILVILTHSESGITKKSTAPKKAKLRTHHLLSSRKDRFCLGKK